MFRIDNKENLFGVNDPLLSILQTTLIFSQIVDRQQVLVAVRNRT